MKIKYFVLACLAWFFPLAANASYIDGPLLMWTSTGTGPFGHYQVFTPGNNLFPTSGGNKGNFAFQAFPHSVTVGTPVTLTGTSKTVQLVDATSSNVVINLPAASSNTDKHYIIKKTDSSVHTITITPNGTDKIDGAGTYVLSAQYSTVEIQSDGANWFECALISPGGGSGTVTSVTFTGDGTVLSSTPSTAVTTSGTVTATLKTQTANTVFGNATASTASPTFTTAPSVVSLGLSGTTALNNPGIQSVGLYGGNVSDGGSNVLIGTPSGGQAATNLTGVEDVCIGTSAGTCLSTGSSSVFIGSSAGANSNAVTGTGNVGVGNQALLDLTGSSGFNTAIGYEAGIGITSGSFNTILGSQEGQFGGPITGSNNLIIGTNGNTVIPSPSTSYSIEIGAGSTSVISAVRCSSAPSSLTTIAGNLSIANPSGMVLEAGKLTVDASLATPSAPSVVKVGSAGAVTYGYEIAAVLTDGTSTSVASSQGQSLNGFFPLSSINYQLISWSSVAGAASYNIYRTAGPAAGVIWVELAAGTSSAPGGICTGPDSNLWFTEPGTAKIGTMTTSGTLTEFASGTSSQPKGICVGPDNNLWFAEPNTTKIGKMTTSGTLTEFAAGIGSIPQQICVGPDNNLWFTEPGANKIGKMTTSGTLTEFSTSTGPNGICVGPDNNLWFTEGNAGGLNKIGKMTTSGTLTEFAAGVNSTPTGICTGPDSNLWFTEFNTNKIGKITTSGTLTEFSAGTSSGPTRICVGPDSNLWFTEASTNKIGKMTTSGTLTEFAVGTSSGPGDICVGPDNNLWFTEGTVNKIGVMSAAGNTGLIGNYVLDPSLGLQFTDTGLKASGTAPSVNSTGTFYVNGSTAHGLLIGEGTSPVVSVAPSATSGVPFISQGSSADPIAGTAVVAGGGTGAVTLTGALVGNGTSPITGGTLTVPNGGTGATTLASHGLLVGNGTSAVNITGTGEASGEPMTSQGASADPQFLPGTTDNATKAFQFWAPQATNAITQTLSGTVPIAAITAIVGGTDTTGTGASGKIVNAVTTTSAASSAGWNSSTFTVTEMQCGPIMAARVVTPATLTGNGRPGIWVALTSANEATTQSPTNSIVGFRFWGGVDTDWTCYTAAGSTGTVTDSTLAVVGSTVYDLVIDCSTSGHARFYINGALKADVTLTLPAASTALGVETTVDNVGGTTAASCGFGVMRLETY